jgi:hypothetical protein
MNKTVPGVCGCGTTDVDTDNDGVMDCLDFCPFDPSKTVQGVCLGPHWLDLSTKRTSQSSVVGNAGASKAIDSKMSHDFSHDFGSGSCIHTAAEVGSWWYVDLGVLHDIVLVNVTGHSQCCNDNLNGFSVWVTPAAAQEPSIGFKCADGVSTSMGVTSSVSCNSTTGQKVWIMLQTTNTPLVLCDVKVRASISGNPYKINSSCVSTGLGSACGCGVPDIDTDSDGTYDCFDSCPTDPDKINPGICGCGVSDSADADSDGFPDCIDDCPSQNDDPTGTCDGCSAAAGDWDVDSIPNCKDPCKYDKFKKLPGICGCGVPDTDSDLDSIPDCLDACPTDPHKTVVGMCGCGVPDTDTDNDDIPDCRDGCPLDPLKIAPGTCGCGVSEVDSDGDGIRDCQESCPHFEQLTGDRDLRVSWGSLPVTAPGGQYRICWCANGYDCHTSGKFLIDMGTLTLIGPSPLSQDRTCLSGQTCSLFSIDGLHLSKLDDLWILDTCQVAPIIPRMPYTLDTTIVKADASGARPIWADTPSTAAGGQYRLCWCAGAQSASKVFNYTPVATAQVGSEQNMSGTMAQNQTAYSMIVALYLPLQWTLDDFL